jgi:ketosteroid isomerase-like protein
LPEDDELQPNSAADDFFIKMKHDFRRPKPSEEAVAAALQAIQSLAGEAAIEASIGALPLAPGACDSAVGDRVERCPKCGGENSGSNRFCGFCGTLMNRVAKPAAASPASHHEAPGKHFHHHHYHHHYFPDGTLADSQRVQPPDGTSASSLWPAELADVQSVLRKLVQDWALSCNAKRLDDLAMMYSVNAIALRPGAEPVRGRSAIRQYFQEAMTAGLGDVQLDCTDVGVLGDIACLSGCSRMLLPIAAGNRRERTGKFLMLARYEAGEWKVIADVWCVDPGPPPPPRK